MRILRISPYLIVLSLVALLVHCSKSGNDTPPAPQVTAVMGSVVDTSGTPIAGVQVAGGGASATTDAQGKFQLDAPAAAGTAVTFTKDGFVGTRKRVDVKDKTATALAVVMMPEAPAVPLDAEAGGIAQGTRGAQLAAQAAAFVDSTGSPVTGMVDVHLTAFDPSKESELRALPNLSADTSGGQAVELESFGVLDVTVRQDGKKLDVKSGEQLTIRIPAPAGTADPPATIALWSFDGDKGRWQEEGTATYLAAEGVYEAKIGHMSMWNADQPLTSTCIRGVVKVEGGAPLPGGHVVGSGVDYNGVSEATTDGAGQFCMVVRKSSKVRVTATHPQGGGHVREVQSSGGDTSIPPNCGQCADVGEWVVKAGEIKGPGGETKDCKDVNNPFVGTCADNLWGFSECFNPTGACTYDMTTGEMSWESGAHFTTSGMMGQPGAEMIYWGPGDKKCATGTFSQMSQELTVLELTIHTTNTSFKIEIDGEGNQTIVCPGGQRITMTKEDQEVFQACSGTSQTQQEQCEVVGLPGLCSATNPCPDNGVCCDAGAGYSFCMPAGMECPPMQ